MTEVRVALALLMFVAACAKAAPPSPEPRSGDAATTPAPAVSAPAPAASASASASAVERAAPPSAPSAKARAALFLNDAGRADVVACATLPCLLRLRYAEDAEAARAAEDFFASTGCIAGLDRPSTFEGGWRGSIRIVPELPVGRYRRHLVDAAAAVKRLDDLVTELRARAKKPVRYRARDITFRFFRSVGRTTPSAYAERWSIAYNVSGSLLGSAAGVHETLVHEIFHLNDEGRGGGEGAQGWSAKALGPTFDAILARCGTKAACLAPYAPASTMVKGGTFYAFQPGGGVHEYAAELAVRYVAETEAALGKAPSPKTPFKCGPEENSRVWEAIVGEFFGGVDLTPSCPR